MLFGIPANLPPLLLETLARMGHGDEIAIVDANYPAYSDASEAYVDEPIELPGRDCPQAMADILALMPLDTFDESPVIAMGAPDPADGSRSGPPTVHREMQRVLEGVPGAPWQLDTLERFVFYERVRTGFAVVRTVERRPWGNVILKKGVIAPDGSLMTPEIAAGVT